LEKISKFLLQYKSLIVTPLDWSWYYCRNQICQLLKAYMVIHL